jgi:hypothetical protein
MGVVSTLVGKCLIAYSPIEGFKERLIAYIQLAQIQSKSQVQNICQDKANYTENDYVCLEMLVPHGTGPYPHWTLRQDYWFSITYGTRSTPNLGDLDGTPLYNSIKHNDVNDRLIVASRRTRLLCEAVEKSTPIIMHDGAAVGVTRSIKPNVYPSEESINWMTYYKSSIMPLLAPLDRTQHLFALERTNLREMRIGLITK